MSSKFGDLNDTFNVADDVVETEIVKKSPDKITKPTSDDVRKDYDYTRGNLYSIIEKGQEAINGILELAQESEMPRAYEVAGQLIKTQSEIAQNLLDLQGTLKKLKEEKGNVPKNVTNALFVGSTTELQKLIKKNKDKK